MNVCRLAAMTAIIGVALAAAPQTSDELVVRKPSMPESELLYKVDPDYPSAALQLRIQGTVRFNVVIGKDGHVERLTLVSGHPLLVQAAREAARQWIYRPATLDGQPVLAITDIDVQFQLDPYGKPLKRSNGSSNSAA